MAESGEFRLTLREAAMIGTLLVGVGLAWARVGALERDLDSVISRVRRHIDDDYGPLSETHHELELQFVEQHGR